MSSEGSNGDGTSERDVMPALGGPSPADETAGAGLFAASEDELEATGAGDG